MSAWGNDSLGAAMRAAREQSGVTLRQIADGTKISLHSLNALENDQIDRLPGGIYRRAIVRSYAAHVGLDPDATLRAFLIRHPDDVPTMATMMPTKTRASVNRALHAVIGLASTFIPVVAGVLYFTLGANGDDSSRHVIATTRPSVSLARASYAAAATASQRPAADVTLSRITRQHAASSPRDIGALSMLVSVSSATRLQIVADGRQVLAQRLRAGEVVRLNLSNDVVLVGDNAGAVHFSINGRAGRSLGNDGAPLATRIALADYQDWLITD